jgi:hypothetical protein
MADGKRVNPARSAWCGQFNRGHLREANEPRGAIKIVGDSYRLKEAKDRTANRNASRRGKKSST